MKNSSSGLNWYVVYTKPKSEKKAAVNIMQMGIECYLPMNKVVRQWSDRKKKIEVPLFPNYIFVKVSHSSKSVLYTLNEVVKYISIGGKPVVVKEEDILTIKKILDHELEISPEKYFQKGRKVRIADGQFGGMEGVILQNSYNSRLVVQIDGLMRSFSVNIPMELADTIQYL